MKTQEEKQAGAVIGFNKPNKTLQAFHEPLCRQGSSATALSHRRCQLSKSPPTAHLQDPEGAGESLVEVGQG